MKRKILYIVNSDWFFISHRLPIGLKLLSLGYDVHLATSFSEDIEKLNSLGFKTHELKLDRFELNLFKSLRSFIQILRIVYKIKPEIIHSVTIKPVIFGGLASRIYQKAIFVASISGLGYVFTNKNLTSYILKFIVKKLYKLSLSQRKLKVIFQNKRDEDILTKLCKLKNKDKVLIPGSGIDLDKFKPTLVDKDSNIILFASRLLISKGIIEFISCAKEFYGSGLRFVIAGKLDKDNPDCIGQEILEEEVKAGFVEYLGDVQNIKELILSAKVLLLPSYYGEGLPKILIEAAACGIPVITTNHPGCKDAIINNKTGLLVPIKDVQSLILALKKLLRSKKLCKNMGEEARKLAIEKFDVNNVIKKHIEIYNQF